jgi:uncharacterized protein (TIGR02284 family)
MQHVTNADAVDTGAVISVLNGLIETCKDGEKGYKNAAADVRDPVFRALFTHFSQQRAQFATALQATIERMGGHAENNGSVVGAIRRGWMDLKSALEGGSDHAMLVECERGEDAAKRNYEQAMRKALPYDIEILVQAQYTSILQAHDEMRRMRELHR